MKVAVIGAMDEEMAILIEALHAESVSVMDGVRFFRGYFNQTEIILVQSGIGKVAAAIVTALLKAHFDPQYVINTGSAGGLADNLKTGDMVISTEVAFHDVDVTGFGYAYGQVPKMPPVFQADNQLVSAAVQAAREMKDVHAVSGLIVSGDSFVNSHERVEEIQRHFPAAIALEMEAGAIAQACHILSMRWVVLRAISDKADSGASIDFNAFLHLASQESSRLVLATLAKITS